MIVRLALPLEGKDAGTACFGFYWTICAIVPSRHHSIFIHFCGAVLNAVVSIIVRNAIIVFPGSAFLFKRKLAALSSNGLPFAIIRYTGGFDKGPLSNMALLVHLCCTVRLSTIRQWSWMVISDAFVVNERESATLSIFSHLTSAPDHKWKGKDKQQASDFHVHHFYGDFAIRERCSLFKLNNRLIYLAWFTLFNSQWLSTE